MPKSLLFVLVLSLFLEGQNSNYFQQEVSYNINVTLDPNTFTYNGTEKIVYTNNSPDTLTYIWLHLYPNAFKNETTPFARQQELLRKKEFYFSDSTDKGYINLTSVIATGINIEWHYKQDAIDEAKLILPEALQPGQSVVIDLQFEARFPKAFSRSGHYNNAYFQGTQWYPKVVVYDKQGWHPDSYYEVGEFYGEFSTFDVSITLPENYVIDATGTLQDNPGEQTFIDSIIADSRRIVQIPDKEKREIAWREWRNQHRNKTNFDSLKTVRFVAHNVHDFAWFAGVDYMIHQKVMENGIIARVCVRPENVYDWRFVPDYIIQTLDFYGQKVGLYKYPKASVIDGSQITFGGMEYPMIALIATDYQNWNMLFENVIVHEVGHNWFQGMLGSNERACVFLDEGINSFYDGLYIRHYYGEKGLTEFDNLFGSFNVLDDLGEWDYHQILYAQRISTAMDVPMNLRGDQYNRVNYSIVNYSKGVFMLRALRWMMGDEQFDKAMLEYFRRWHFKHPEIDDFWAVIQEFTDYDLTHFRKEWMQTTHYNDFKIAHYKTEETDKGYRTTVFPENDGEMKDIPVPVYLITTANDTLQARWSGHVSESVEFLHKKPLKKLEINLNKEIFELYYLNNGTFLPDFEFSFLDPVPSFSDYKFTFYPLVSYEYFNDGLRLGAGFWSGNFLTQHYFMVGNFYYGTQSSQLGYKLKITNRFPGTIGNYTDIEMGILDKDGFKGIMVSAGIEIIDPSDTSVRHNLLICFNDSKLYDMDYHEKNMYEKSHYNTLTLGYILKLREMLWRNDLSFSIEKTVNLFNSNRDYIKYEFSNKYRYYISGKSNILWDFYTGMSNGDNIPQQELVFAGGDVDPKHQALIPAYRGSSAPLRNFSLNSGMQMLGHAHTKRVFRKNKSGYAMGLEFDLPYLPQLYGRMASLFEEPADFLKNDPFYEAGFKLGNEYFSLIFPLYISDPGENEKNTEFRIFYNFSFPF